MEETNSASASNPEAKVESEVENKSGVVVTDINTLRLHQQFVQDGVAFPADADEGRRRGGVVVTVDESQACK